MADEPQVTPTPAPSPEPISNNNDAVSMAKRLGELESENKRLSSEYSEYKQRVDPVIETLYSDQELLTKATESHKKRLGFVDPNAPSPKEDKVDPTVIRDPKARAAINNQNMMSFEDKAGISKLDEKKKGETRALIGQMIKNMVDPQNNKTIQQVFDEIDPDRFPWYLDNAYSLINKQEEIARAKEEGKNEALNGYQGGTGVIGSIPSGSFDPESVQLTPKEKLIAKNMGVTEENYLKNKKRILEIKNSPND